MAAVMAAMFMIAIEATIVSTAMPQIAVQLGDLHLYSWVFAAFLLAQTATTMVFGKLSDVFGRKPVLLVGIAIFLVGSILCGMAWSMPSLIVFRVVQGFGAGAIQPIALTIVGDLYPGPERSRIQGYLSSVWGISSVLGPLAGGLITQHLNWAWVFWINVPVGIAASIGFTLFLHEQVAHAMRKVDVPGAVLFAVAVASLMAGLTELGASSQAALIAAAVCAVSTVLFVLQERRAAEPMVDFALWTRRPIATANAATLLSGMAIIGLSAFLPMYVQGVLNRSALVAGFTLTAMSFGWPVGAILAAKGFHRVGLRAVFLFGGALLPVGAFLILQLRPGLSPAVAGIGSLVMGLGMGLLSTAAIVIVQGSVGWAERSAATASNVFSRNLGSTFGATLMGGVLNTSLAHQGAGGSVVGFDQIRRLLDLPGLADPAVQHALSQGLHLTFWAMFLITVSTFAVANLVPRVALKPAE
ncbi:MAG: MDR family MFS transporter [Acetobacteraceae bacterium]